MPAPEYRRLLERLRELATQAKGQLRAIPVGRLAEGLPEGLPLDQQVRITMPAEDRPDGQPRIEVRPIRLRGRTHPPTGTTQIRGIEVELRVVRALPLDAIKSDGKRYDEHGLAAEDGELLAQAIEWPENLRHTSAGEPTGCISLVHVASDPAVRSGPKGAGQPQIIETIHRFTGRIRIDTSGGVAAPVNTLAPSINVDGGGDPVLGSVLVATPGVWSDAVLFAYQWLRNGLAIAGATSLRYTVVADDDGASILFRETAFGGGGNASAESNAIVPGAATPVPLPDGFPVDDVRQLWVASERVYAPDGDGHVYSWGDVVTGGALHRQSGARSPIAIASSPNLGDLPSVQFRAATVGADTRLSENDQSSHLFVQQPTAPGATFFVAWYKGAEQATTDAIFDTSNLVTNRSGFNLFHSLLAGATQGTLTLRIGRDMPSIATVVSLTTASGSVPAGAHYAVVRLLTGGSPEWELRADGVVLGSGAFASSPGTDLTALGGLSMGGRSGTTTSTGLEGEIGTAGFFDRRIDDAELAELETWLARYTA